MTTTTTAFREPHCETPIWRMANADHGATEFLSLYDELFSLRVGAAATERVFEGVESMSGVMDYFLANFGNLVSEKTLDDLRVLEERGGSFRKLVFVLLMLVHDPTLRAQIEDTCDPSQRTKVSAFSRPLSIAARSLYVAPYRTSNVKSILLTLVTWLWRAWACCDADACAHLCDAHAARCRTDDDVERSAQQTAQWIANLSARQARKAERKIGKQRRGAAKTIASEGEEEEDEAEEEIRT